MHATLTSASDRDLVSFILKLPFCKWFLAISQSVIIPLLSYTVQLFEKMSLGVYKVILRSLNISNSDLKKQRLRGSTELHFIVLAKLILIVLSIKNLYNVVR